MKRRKNIEDKIGQSIYLGILTCILMVLASCAASARQPSSVLEIRKGLFAPIFVIQETGIRYLRFDSISASDQSAYDPNHPQKIIFEVFQHALAATQFESEPTSALVMGVGGGNYIRALRQTYPNCSIVGVDIDEVVVDLARKYFGLDDKHDEQMSVHIQDGGQFIHTTQSKWDHILLDTYDGENIPAHLSSHKYFNAVRNRLSTNGHVLLNLAMTPDKEQSVLKAFKRAFPNCMVMQVPGSGNTIAAGFAGPQAPAKAWQKNGYTPCEQN